MASETAPPKRRKRDVFEIIAVFVLAATAVLTAWCGFQSSKWGGEMSIAFSQASSQRIQAANYDSQARDTRLLDLTIYAQWVVAGANNQPELQAYVEERFSPQFDAAYAAWVADGMVENSPFSRPEYVPPGEVEAAAATKEADEKFASALENNTWGDHYSLLTVLFALVLFLTAMSQRKISEWAARVLLCLAIAVGIIGVTILSTFPIDL